MSERRSSNDDPAKTVPLIHSDSNVNESELEFSCDSLSGSATENDTNRQLGRYHLRGLIAVGGMGRIVRAYDSMLHRDVAIKLLRSEFADDACYLQRFVNEALLTSQLQHPSIIPIYDLGHEEDGRPFFVMKLVEGRSLSEVLAVPPKNRLDRSHLLKIFEQVCQTVAYAHSNGVLHLDLKPSNIMIGEFGEVHVMDWGLAHVYDIERLYVPSGVTGGSKLPVPNERLDPSSDVHVELAEGHSDLLLSHVRGTPAYMAPEQARGRAVSTRSDVFGLGAILCEILTGQPPYPGRDHRRVYQSAVRARVRSAIRGCEQMGRDDQLTQIVKRCLAPNPRHRPADASVVAKMIGQYLATALEQAESDLCRFFELSLDLFCIASLDGYFLRVNENFPKVLGYPENKLISQPFMNFVHPDDVEVTQSVMANLSEGKPVVRFRNRYRRTDGDYIVLEWTAQTNVNEGTIFAVARDVTRHALNEPTRNEPTNP